MIIVDVIVKIQENMYAKQNMFGILVYVLVRFMNF